MKIKWYGHSAFLVTSDQGVTIIIDPYDPQAYRDNLSYDPIQDPADIVLSSHDHGDHNGVKGLPGSPEVVKGSGDRTVKGITIKGISTFHDSSTGSERGENTIFTFAVDSIQICHLGDLGHILSDQEIREIGPVDILLIPVGGYYTIDALAATRVMEQMKPKVVIPMHVKTKKCTFPIAAVDDFLKGKWRVNRQRSSEMSFTKTSLPQKTEVVVLEHAL